MAVIFCTGKHLFVGLSRRTNAAALKQLEEIFGRHTEVLAVPVIEGLHLKSVVSLFDRDTLIVADTPAGREVHNIIQTLTEEAYQFVFVPDSVASNVLRIGAVLVVQDGFPKSEKILQDLCEQKEVNLLKLNMSELVKADGALTCGSLLL